MAKEKGLIKTDNVGEKQSFNWIKEIFSKLNKDPLNVKEEEHTAISEVIEKLEKKYYKYKNFYKFIKPKLSSKQKDDYIEYLEE